MKWIALALVGLVACSRSPEWHDVDPPPAVAMPANTETDILVWRFQCTRCHEVPRTEPAVRDKHCVTCHQQIHAGTFEAKAETITRWRGHIQSLRSAPSLVAAARLNRAWVKQFLLHPHDVRPGSIAQMPRLAITEPEAEKLATFLVPVETAGKVEMSPLLVVRGEHLYRQFLCARCHRFTGASVDDPGTFAATQVNDEMRRSASAVDELAIAWTLAPDLRFARDRVQPARLAGWIEHPGGAMPTISGIGPLEAEALAVFIAHVSLSAPPKLEVPQRLPVLEREVSWTEVSVKVFHDTCWHCHAVPDFARGDGGPGNSGGFGFEPRGLDVSSYTGISEGSFGGDGERRSIFEKLSDGTPRVIAHLMARHVESSGGIVDGVRGMPLGLPPLTLEQIQLVESWIVQGRPQ